MLGERYMQGRADVPFCEIVFLNEFNMPLSPDVWSLTLVKSRGCVHDPAIEAATPVSLVFCLSYAASIPLRLIDGSEQGCQVWELTS